MFVALRDIRFAKGRFALMGAVVVLITTLVVFLYGLTGGLTADSSSAITGLPGQDVVFGAPAGSTVSASFSQSSISPAQLRAWKSAPGVGSVAELGVNLNRLTAPGGSASVSVLGADGSLMPALVSGSDPEAGQVGVSRRLAESEHLGVGGRVTLGSQSVTVSGITRDASYGHAPTVWTTIPTWEAVSGQSAPTALVVDPDSADTGALDQAQNTTMLARDSAVAAIDGYSAEHDSLEMIQVFLFVVSALVIGAFFTVWTVQRKPDIAVLKALGASSGYLVRDALAQALILLVTGTALGSVIGLAGGALLSAAGLPYSVSALTIAVPFGAMVLLGLVGAVLAVRRITSVDPLTALGAGR